MKNLNIKKRINRSSVLFTALLLSSNAFSQDVIVEETRDYKCYVKDSFGNESIRVQFAKSAEDAKQKKYGKFYRKNGKQHVIRYVEECVKVADEFTGKKAKELSKEYPM